MNKLEFQALLDTFFPLSHHNMILEMITLLTNPINISYHYVGIGFWEPYTMLRSIIRPHLDPLASLISANLKSPKSLEKITNNNSKSLITPIHLQPHFLNSKILPNTSFLHSYPKNLPRHTPSNDLSPSMSKSTVNELCDPYKEHMIKCGNISFVNAFQHPQAYTSLSPVTFINDFLRFKNQLQWNPQSLYSKYSKWCYDSLRIPVGRDDFKKCLKDCSK